MIGMIAGMAGRAALRNGVNATSKGATPPSEVKPTPCHPVAIAVVVIGLIAVFAASAANGGQVVAWITPMAVILGLVALGGIFASGVSDAKRRQRAFHQIASVPNANDRGVQRAQMAAYVTQLEAPRPQLSREEILARRGAPLTPQAPVDNRSKPSPHLTTFNEKRRQIETRIRGKRVRDILKADCPVCTADSTVPCTFHPGQEVVKLDTGVVVHAPRIGNALTTHTAKLADVKAQFNGSVPENVMVAAI